MRILLAADQYPEFHNGAGAFTERLAAGLQRRGHELTVIYPSATGHESSSSRGGIRDIRVGSVRLPKGQGVRASNPYAARRLADQLLTRTKFDVVHVQSHLPVGRAVLSAARQRQIPLVATNHFMPENFLPHLPVSARIGRRLADWGWRDLARIYRQADLITTPTQRAAELLRARSGLGAIQVISNGVDLTRYAPGPAVDDLDPEVPSAPAAGPACDNDPYVLFVGRLEQEKQVEVLLSAFAAVPHELQARLVYIGSGSRLLALKQLAATAGIADRVEFWGNVSDDRLRRAYAGCAVFCAPGIAELQSLVALEAVASGAPIIAADAVALPHLVDHGGNGFRYPPARPELLTSHLTNLLSSPALRRRMGAQSRRIAQVHAIDATLDAYLDCYQTVIELTPRITARNPAPARLDQEPALAA